MVFHFLLSFFISCLCYFGSYTMEQQKESDLCRELLMLDRPDMDSDFKLFLDKALIEKTSNQSDADAIRNYIERQKEKQILSSLLKDVL